MITRLQSTDRLLEAWSLKIYHHKMLCTLYQCKLLAPNCPFSTGTLEHNNAQLAKTFTLTLAVTSGWSFNSAIYSPVSLISGRSTILLSTSLEMNHRKWTIYHRAINQSDFKSQIWNKYGKNNSFPSFWFVECTYKGSDNRFGELGWSFHMWTLNRV